MEDPRSGGRQPRACARAAACCGGGRGWWGTGRRRGRAGAAGAGRAAPGAPVMCAGRRQATRTHCAADRREPNGRLCFTATPTERLHVFLL